MNLNEYSFVFISLAVPLNLEVVEETGALGD